ncbi:MAG: hypothetical protein H6Q73_1480 [Firmicutes bacterium]|nr:hypothetical protein [Bacillota bacterium]
MVLLLQNIHAKNNGYIFIDVVIGMCILSIALLTFLDAVRQTTVNTVNNRNYPMAVYIANKKMEQLKLQSGSGNFIMPTDNPAVVAANGVYPQFIVSVSQPEVKGLESNLTALQVNVNWQDATPGGATYTRTVTIYGYHIKAY